MAVVRVLTGTRQAGREELLDDVFRDNPLHTRLLVPTGAYDRQRTKQIIRYGNIPGLWGRPVQTFQSFVTQLLDANNVAVKPLDEGEQRMLTEQVAANLIQDGKLSALGPAAESDGFITHALRIIRQLKQAAVEPEAFAKIATNRPNASALDEAVAALYAAYQYALKTAKVYDRDGLYWEAATLCADESNPPAGLRNVKHLILDGYDEFTPAQYRLLKRIAPYLDHMTFGIAIDTNNASARDLYDVPLNTVSTLQSIFDATLETCDEQAPATVSQFAARNLFWRDEPRAPATLDKNLVLQPCATPLHELEVIGRRIKTLIQEQGLAPERIALVFRDISNAAPRIQSIFEEFGIPAEIVHRPSLAESSIATFVLALFEALEQWDRNAACDVLASPWFAIHNNGTSTHAYAALARAAQIISGKSEWQRQLNYLAERIDAGDDIPRMPALDDRATAVASMQKSVTALAAIDDALNRKATPATFAHAVIESLSDLNPRAVLAALPPHLRDRETAAMDALFLALDRFAEWHENEEKALTRSDFAARLRRLFSETRFAIPQPRGGVTCMDAETARHQQFDHVFFAGLTEGAIPQRPALNAIYTDYDIAEFRENDIELSTQHYRTSYEMLLFHRVFDCASEQLWLTWPTLGADGKTLLPSPYVAELQEDWLSESITVNSAPRMRDLVPPLDDAASMRDAANAYLIHGDKALSKPPDLLAPIVARARIEQTRFQRKPCDRYDGVFADPNLVQAMAHAYGPDRQFSVSLLEKYFECPFRFFMEDLLHVVEQPEPEEAFDPLTRGSIYHEILEKFHRRFAGLTLAQIGDQFDDARNYMRDTTNEVFDRYAVGLGFLPQGILEVERAAIHRALQQYLATEVKRRDAKEWTPAHFEVAFGRSRGDSDPELSRDEPFTLETHGETIRFAGKIDRIDQSDNGARLVDYKSSVSRLGDSLNKGLSLQLFIYGLAYEQYLCPDHPCAVTLFLQTDARGRQYPYGGKEDKRPEREAQALLNVLAAVNGIRAGRFHPTLRNESCSYCPAQRPCRYHVGRMAEKAAAEGVE